MKSTKIDSDIQRTLLMVLDRYPEVREIIKDIEAYGGRAYLVGGAVRDLYLGISIKDIDIEVHFMPVDALEALLHRYGNVNNVGKSFGVLRLGNIDIDWSLPRTDSSGRKPIVIVNPSLSIQDACARRDLTMNAMAIDLHTMELYDPFDGRQDVEKKVLRTPNPDFFIQDPLRFYRVMQFISRFDMYPDEQLYEVCRHMSLAGVSVERIEQEFKKMLLKSKRPSLGIRWLKDIARLPEVMPELASTIGVKQPHEWHREGDVFEHSMQTLDAAAALTYDSSDQRLIMLYAALCHDLGKVVTTVFDQEKGRITSYGHDEAGVPLARALLQRITKNKEVIETVEKLVRYHMMPLEFYDGGARSAAYKRLAYKLASHVTMEMLAKLALADLRGTNGQGQQPLTSSYEAIDQFIAKAQACGVLNSAAEPLLLGKDFADVVAPGPQMGVLVKRAYELQIDEGIRNKDELKQRVITEMNKNEIS